MFKIGYQNNIGIITDNTNKNTLTSIILYETSLKPICFTELSRFYFDLNAKPSTMSLLEWQQKITERAVMVGAMQNALKYLIENITDEESKQILLDNYSDIINKGEKVTNALYKKS